MGTLTVNADILLTPHPRSFCMAVLLLLCLALVSRVRAETGPAPPPPCAGLSTERFTLRPDDPRWPAFLVWAKEQRLFTSRLVAWTASGLSVRWATGTQWETQVTLPVGHALAHLIAERQWQDTDFPGFFAPRGGVYAVNVAERLALEADPTAAWQAFFDTFADTPRLSAHLSVLDPDGQSAEVRFGSDRAAVSDADNWTQKEPAVVTYSAQRLLLDFRSFLTDCRVSAFFQAAGQSAGQVSGEPGPPPASDSASLLRVPRLQERGHALYEQQCAGCHGRKGDGQGVFAARLSPRPRDFTRGLFRYRSTPTGQLPTDADLSRSVTHGLAGSGMPAFGAFLSPADIRAVVAYLKRFSPRFTREAPPPPLPVSDPPAVSAERLARGARLYRDSGCPSCHGPGGRGNGRSGQDLKTSEGEPIAPRDLTDRWRFRGGSSPPAVYLRLAAGMDGSSMASYSDALTEDQMWNLALYVLALSPPERPPAAVPTP